MDEDSNQFEPDSYGPPEPERQDRGLMLNQVPEGLAQEEEDDDFPDYANEQNKQLNQIVRNEDILSI